jgi:CO/xanthine dehydrogenase FAD-binding subunit
MRAQPSEYELVAPGKLSKVLELLAREPGVWLPIAGGTEVMVQYGAGRLGARKLVSLWGLPELRRIERTSQETIIGAGCTYSDLRKHLHLAQEFPLLGRAASWTGSIANQNRGTLGGNIVNASPAADSLPALLVYEAELLLVSARGERRIPYAEFHTGYKQTVLAADEIIAAIALQPRFNGYYSYSRKVGTRNAQAIAKLCLAGLGKVSGNKIEDVRLAIGSMAVTPLRLKRTETVLLGQAWSPTIPREARKAMETEVAPIDDIRSTAAYRLHVAGNLLQEFVEALFASESVESEP